MYVLLLTGFIITALTVDEKNEEIADIEIGNGRVEQGREGPRKGHNEITARTA
jgi:hypothetical protein